MSESVAFAVELESWVFSDAEAMLARTTHIDIDQAHGAMLKQLLLHHGVTADARRRIREGAQRSLDLRADLWSAIEALWRSLG